MKKLLIILLTAIIFTGWGVTQVVLADGLVNPLGYENFGDLINAIIKFIFDIALVVAPLMIVIGGFYIVAAAGNPSNIETGKRIIFYTLIGFLIILISRGLVVVIQDLLKVAK